MEKKDLISVRAYTPPDKNFILATWLKGLRYGNETFEFIQQDIYFEIYNRVIESILKRDEISVKVACLKDDPEVILGYSVFENKTVHWIFCKQAWRKIGIARMLLPEGFNRVTHITTAAKAILTHKFPNVIFNPFIGESNG